VSIHRRTGKKGVSYQVRYRRESGEQASRTFSTKKEAERFEATLVVDDGDLRGLTREQRKTTFAQYAAKWQRLKEHRHRERTRERRDQILRLHLLPVLGDMPIRSIRPTHLLELVGAWEKNGLSPYTIRNHIAIARPIFGLAIKDGVIQRDPTQDLELPPLPKSKGTVLDQEQCRLLLANVKDAYRRMFYVLLATGLRIGELFALQVGDVDPDRKLLRVRESKTSTGVREIDLSANDVQVLVEQIKSLGRDGEEPRSILFRSPRGKGLQYRNIAERALKKVIADTGLPKFTFHDLRKTHATMLVAAGMDPKVIQQRLGHESIETTLKYYAQPTKERQIAAAHVAVSYLAADTASTQQQTLASAK
jgi:integrase